MSAAYDERRTERAAERPVSELVSDALQQFSRLIRNEMALARAEMTQKAKSAMQGGMMLGVAVAVALPALFILMMALAALFIELGLAASLSYLITAVIGFIIAGVVAKLGLNQLKADALTPNRTINQLHRDVQTVREHV
jgi:uncharacterized membrane protein YqjE